MNTTGYYSTGQFMKLGHITKKTVRYYDEHHILKPSYVDPKNGARYYTDEDLARLQQILLLKYLGFSLADIREMTINDGDGQLLADSLKLQQKLIDDRIEQLQLVSRTIRETTAAVERDEKIDWCHMLSLIDLMNMEQSMKSQYKNTSNISARIHLHTLYSENKQGWFPWIFEQCSLNDHQNVLEIGCGDGALWTENLERVPAHLSITLSDISEGMLRDIRRTIGLEDARFSFYAFDCQDIPYKDETFDLVIANHVLFYCHDLKRACEEIRRILKPGGILICSTYGGAHMNEVSRLVTAFDDRIVLSAEKLYEIFGRENGQALLSEYFSDVTWKPYEDALFVTEAGPLIAYVLSCHGNQNQLITDHYTEFKHHVKKYIGSGMKITKDAGIFICAKNKA